MKKNFFSFIFAIFLIIPCIFLSMACSPSAEKAWGKTFTYQGKFLRDFDSSDESSPRKLLTQEFDANNLDLENVKFCYTSSNLDNDGNPNEVEISANLSDVNNVNELIAEINQNVASIFDESCSSLSVSVGNKDEKRITINGTEYELSNEPTEKQDISGGTWGVVNKNYDPSDPNSYKYIAYIDETLLNIKLAGDEEKSTFLSYSECSPKEGTMMVKVFTKSYKEGDGFLPETADKSYIYINFFIYLSPAN